MKAAARQWIHLICACLLWGLAASTAATAQGSVAAPAWMSQNLAVISSELSPAVLVHTTRSRVDLVAGLDRWGLGAPLHAALQTTRGVPVLSRQPDGSLVLPTRAMAAPWILVWFRGSAGWTAWDSPWLVVWQHRPDQLSLDAAGLHAAARKPLGFIALLPLYGIFKPDTRRWSVLPADAVRRCRFWSRALRQYPIGVDETFRLDPGSDSIVVRDRFTFLDSADDWHTSPLRIAPLPPTLALAGSGGRMPMRLSAPVVNPGLFTSFGPYVGIAGREYTISFPVLHYITQTEAELPPDTRNPVAVAALERLQRAMRQAFSSPDGLFHQDFGDPAHFADPPPQVSDGGNTCWALMADQYECRALPYLPADLVEQAKPRLHRYFADWVLQPERFKPFRGKLLLVGPGIGTWGGYDDAGKFSSNTLITLWTYAHFTGDWDLIRQRWPLIKRLFVTPRESSWRGFGRETIAEMGDEAAPALAMARLAYFVGDRQQFAYAAYIFTRELVDHVVKHTGAAAFVQRQPINGLEPMPPNVYLTNLWGDTAGWQIDGPTYPRETGERQYTNRWVRFGDPDVARFHRDHLQDLDRRELDHLLASGRFTRDRKGAVDDPHILPSMVRLRSLLLDESPEALARITPVDAPTAALSGDAAFAWSFLRTSRPIRFKTIIPAAAARTGWQPGLEQDRPEDEPVLDVVVSDRVGGNAAAAPPALTWWGWSPPKRDPAAPGGDRWSFGQIKTDLPATAPREDRLSWNSKVISYPQHP